MTLDDRHLQQKEINALVNEAFGSKEVMTYNEFSLININRNSTLLALIIGYMKKCLPCTNQIVKL